MPRVTRNLLLGCERGCQSSPARRASSPPPHRCSCRGSKLPRTPPGQLYKRPPTAQPCPRPGGTETRILSTCIVSKLFPNLNACLAASKPTTASRFIRAAICSWCHKLKAFGLRRTVLPIVIPSFKVEGARMNQSVHRKLTS